MTSNNHIQRDKQTEFKNIVKSEHISLTTKLVISFNSGNINAIAPKKKSLIFAMPFI